MTPNNKDTGRKLCIFSVQSQGNVMGFKTIIEDFISSVTFRLTFHSCWVCMDSYFQRNTFFSWKVSIFLSGITVQQNIGFKRFSTKWMRSESNLFLAQLNLTLFDNVFFVQQLLLLTFKVVLALRKKTRRWEATIYLYSQTMSFWCQIRPHLPNPYKTLWPVQGHSFSLCSPLKKVCYDFFFNSCNWPCEVLYYSQGDQ